jgi:hypothetical protein
MMPGGEIIECRDRDGRKIRVNLGGSKLYTPPRKIATFTITLDLTSRAWKPMKGPISIEVTEIRRTVDGRWVVAGIIVDRLDVLRFIATGEEINVCLFDWGYHPVRLKCEDDYPIIVCLYATKKAILTPAQYEVIKALVDAGDKGLSMKQLQSVRRGARGILDLLMLDRDWKSVIRMAKGKGGRYRICHAD